MTGPLLGRRTGVRILAIVMFLAAGVLLAAFRAVPAVATTLTRVPIEVATLRASTVFIGTVVGMETEQVAGGVRTAVHLWVDESLKGDVSGLVTVYVPGGELPDGSSISVDSMASFAPGERCCVFADERGWVIGGYQGKVHLAGAGGGGGETSASVVIDRIDAALRSSGFAVTRPVARPANRASPSVSMLAMQPVISLVSPGYASAGTHSRVKIQGAGFGSIPGKIEFPLEIYGIARLAADQILSWTDSEIVCEVPVGSIGGFDASVGSGPLVVTHQNGSQSNPYEFRVPFGYSGSKWAVPEATYYLNTAGADSARRERLVDAAATTWNSARSSFVFVDGGPTSARAAKDKMNSVSWSDTLTYGEVALTLGYKDAGGQIGECDLQFSNAVAWGDGVTAGTTDIESLALHEFGHWVSLLDQYADADADKVMYGLVAVGQRRELTLGEISGIRWVYPAPSGTLRGTVRSTSGAPIADASISVETCEPVASDSGGNFTVTGVPVGSYRVTCARPGFTTQLFSVTISAESTTDAVFTLAPGDQTSVYRFFHKARGSHFYTASVSERDSVVAKLSRFYTLEGTAYTLNRIDPANTAPLYRFFNKKNGSHFYTASVAERDHVRTRLAAIYKYEGVAYNVASAATFATSPVFRFFNKKNGSHFYTTSLAEKRHVIGSLSKIYVYEGPAFWVAH